MTPRSQRYEIHTVHGRYGDEHEMAGCFGRRDAAEKRGNVIIKTWKTLAKIEVIDTWASGKNRVILSWPVKAE